MKKYLKYIPHVIFAASLVFMGALGKLTGAEKSVELFKMLNLFGQPEYVGRYLIGLAQLFAGVGVFFKPTRKIAALVGTGVMAGAIYMHITAFGVATMAPAVITFLAGLWIFVKSCGCCMKKCNKGACKSKCNKGTCEVKES